MMLIDPAQVSAWGVYNPEKHTFEYDWSGGTPNELWVFEEIQ
jgi:hypothetical protein